MQKQQKTYEILRIRFCMDLQNTKK